MVLTLNTYNATYGEGAWTGHKEQTIKKKPAENIFRDFLFPPILLSVQTFKKIKDDTSTDMHYPEYSKSLATIYTIFWFSSQCEKNRAETT